MEVRVSADLAELEVWVGSSTSKELTILHKAFLGVTESFELEALLKLVDLHFLLAKLVLELRLLALNAYNRLVQLISLTRDFVNFLPMLGLKRPDLVL